MIIGINPESSRFKVNHSNIVKVSPTRSLSYIIIQLETQLTQVETWLYLCFKFSPFLAQTMHRMRPGGVINLHIWCLQYTLLLAVNTVGKLHYQQFLLDTDCEQNPTCKTSFATLRSTSNKKPTYSYDTGSLFILSIIPMEMFLLPLVYFVSGLVDLVSVR